MKEWYEESVECREHRELAKRKRVVMVVVRDREVAEKPMDHEERGTKWPQRCQLHCPIFIIVLSSQCCSFQHCLPYLDNCWTIVMLPNKHPLHRLHK